MICHEYKTIFVHIPRNGGTSVKSMFNNVTEIIHDTEVQSIKSEYPNYFEEYYKWTIVRNPWERELSLYWAANNGLSFIDHLNQNVKPSVENNTGMYKNQKSYITIGQEVNIDQIVRMEAIDNSWMFLCKKLNMPAAKIPNLGKSQNTGSPYQIYNKESIDLVARIRFEDIEFLNYECPY